MDEQGSDLWEGRQSNLFVYASNDPCSRLDPRGTDAASLAAAGALFCAVDGPLPIGDLIGIPLLVAAGAVAVAGATDLIWNSRKDDIKQIDRIAEAVGLDRDQRRRLHDEITKQGLDLSEIEEIAREIKEGARSNRR